MKWRFTQTLIFRARVYPLIFRIGILSKNLNLEHVPIELQKCRIWAFSIKNSAQLGQCNQLLGQCNQLIVLFRKITFLAFRKTSSNLERIRNTNFVCTKWTIKMAVLSWSNVQNENEPSWAIDLPCNQLIGYWLRSRQGANFINRGLDNNVMYRCSARQNAK